MLFLKTKKLQWGELSIKIGTKSADFSLHLISVWTNTLQEGVESILTICERSNRFWSLKLPYTITSIFIEIPWLSVASFPVRNSNGMIYDRLLWDMMYKMIRYLVISYDGTPKYSRWYDKNTLCWRRTLHTGREPCLNFIKRHFICQDLKSAFSHSPSFPTGL